jgi:hypothetical protein
VKTTHRSQATGISTDTSGGGGSASSGMKLVSEALKRNKISSRFLYTIQSVPAAPVSNPGSCKTFQGVLNIDEVERKSPKSNHINGGHWRIRVRRGQS